MKYFMKALQIMGAVSAWSVTALEDGKVTGKEAFMLVEEICRILDVPLEIDFTDEESEGE